MPRCSSGDQASSHKEAAVAPPQQRQLSRSVSTLCTIGRALVDVPLLSLTIYLFQNPWEGMRNVRLKREVEFSQAIIIVISAMVSSS
jgi:hypothetical protein